MKSGRLIPSLGALALVLTLPLAARAGDPASSAPSQPAPAAKEQKSSGMPSSKTRVVHKSAKTTYSRLDLNTATKEELMKAPGVTDAIADQIIAARPFKSRTELLSKKIVTREEYAKLRTHVMVKSHLAAK
jgi:DNA uptake protein ComE-like DNA-binding protein